MLSGCLGTHVPQSVRAAQGPENLSGVARLTSVLEFYNGCGGLNFEIISFNTSAN